VQAERHARREDSTQNCHMERSAAPWRSYDRLPVPWCRGTLPAILKPVAKAFKADARDIADGGPNDRYLSRFHRRGSGVPTMYALRKEFPRSTGVERANTRATASTSVHRVRLGKPRTSGSEAALAAADTYAVGGR
jgi:hypothetical protein